MVMGSTITELSVAMFGSRGIRGIDGRGTAPLRDMWGNPRSNIFGIDVHKGLRNTLIKIEGVGCRSVHRICACGDAVCDNIKR